VRCGGRRENREEERCICWRKERDRLVMGRVKEKKNSWQGRPSVVRIQIRESEGQQGEVNKKRER
jgi:hypothetical protein